MSCRNDNARGKGRRHAECARGALSAHERPFDRDLSGPAAAAARGRGGSGGADGAVLLACSRQSRHRRRHLLAAVDVQKNAVHIASHFLGGVMLSRVVLYELPSAYLWHVVLVAHLPSSCCTLDALRHLFLTRASPHRY